MSKELCTVIFTDGAVEGSVATCGGVVCLAGDPHIYYFDCTIPKELVERWHAMGSSHPVAQAELIPVLM
eukprot:3681535-Amphidinium_carterae.1